MNLHIQRPASIVFALVLAVVCHAETISFNVTGANGKPLPCRIHLKNAKGEAQKAAGQPFWHDHFVCDGNVTIDVAPDKYTWDVERGPEYQRVSGTVEVVANKSNAIDVSLARISDLRDEGWSSGDLHVHRKVEHIELLMMAEDLDYAPVIEWWNVPAKVAQPVAQTESRFDGHRIASVQAGEDEREGGALLYFGLNRPLDLTVKSREFPSPMRFVQEARQIDRNVWIDIEKPFWWDVPTWLASGKMNSVGLANNHMNRSRMLENEAWGRPRDVQRLPNPRGNGFWTQEIYYHILNAGLRIPPSAGSASGVLKNPVGYNRVYAQLGDDEFTRDNWFNALSAGRSFVTNGPLLRVKADGQWAGTTLKLSNQGSRIVKFDVQLTSNDFVSHVEVVQNGRIAHRIPCSTETDQHLVATLQINGPGWFLLRAITDVDFTFRFASTSPWYVESDSVRHRISRPSAQFFLDWVDERIERIRGNVKDAEQLRAVLEPHEQARVFWANRVQMANADLEQD